MRLRQLQRRPRDARLPRLRRRPRACARRGARRRRSRSRCQAAKRSSARPRPACRCSRPPSWQRDPRWTLLLRDLLRRLDGRLVDGTARSARRARSPPATTLTWSSRPIASLAGIMLGLDLGSAPLIAAGLQVYFTHLVGTTAAACVGARIAPFGRIDDETFCPCCGSRPTASVTRIGAAESGYRYLACSLCSTQWHMVRIKCAHCLEHQGHHLPVARPAGRRRRERAAGSKARRRRRVPVELECCGECGHYLKIVHMERDPNVEPIADDLASLTLDLLASESGETRHGVNLMLFFGDPDSARRRRRLVAATFESMVHGSKATPRQLPSLDRLLRHADVGELVGALGHSFVAAEARSLLSELRARAGAGKLASADAAAESIARTLRERCERRSAYRLRPVLNLTGTVIHTNLGRAVLAEAALAHRREQRARRQQPRVRPRRRRPRRARRASSRRCSARSPAPKRRRVVNNNAAAVLLTIAALARGREVIVSRGELVEIGGAFRMPDVMASAGATLVEVGTTNRTHLADYEARHQRAHRADHEGARQQLRGAGLHRGGRRGRARRRSRARAACRSPPISAAARWSTWPATACRASRCRRTCSPPAATSSPSPATSCSAGRRPGSSSAQAAAIERIRRFPMKRALRVSKLPLAALEATLALYRDPDRLVETLPTLRLLTRPLVAIRALAERACVRRWPTAVAPRLRRRGRRAAGPDRLGLAADRAARLGRPRDRAGDVGEARPRHGARTACACAARAAAAGARPHRRRSPAARPALPRRAGAVHRPAADAGRATAGQRQQRLGQRSGERAMIVGTAGHIDHGKTTLVRALTGVDTDRLPEEKRARHQHRARLRLPRRRGRGRAHRLRRRARPRAPGRDHAGRRHRHRLRAAPGRRRRRRDAADARASRRAEPARRAARRDRRHARPIASMPCASPRSVGRRASSSPARAFDGGAAGRRRRQHRPWHRCPARDAVRRRAGADRSARPTAPAFASPSTACSRSPGRARSSPAPRMPAASRSATSCAWCPQRLSAACGCAASTRRTRPADVARRGQRVALGVVGVDKAAIERGAWLVAPESRCKPSASTRASTSGTARRGRLRSGATVHVHIGASDALASVAVLDRRRGAARRRWRAQAIAPGEQRPRPARPAPADRGLARRPRRAARRRRRRARSPAASSSIRSRRRAIGARPRACACSMRPRPRPHRSGLAGRRSTARPTASTSTAWRRAEGLLDRRLRCVPARRLARARAAMRPGCSARRTPRDWHARVDRRACRLPFARTPTSPAPMPPACAAWSRRAWPSRSGAPCSTPRSDAARSSSAAVTSPCRGTPRACRRPSSASSKSCCRACSKAASTRPGCARSPPTRASPRRWCAPPCSAWRGAASCTRW